MSSSADLFLKNILGSDFFDKLEKIELWKMGTKTILDHEEMKTALQIVPRALMTFLINHLRPMQIGETKEVELPVSLSRPLLKVSKFERDVYSGEITDSTEKYTNKKVAEFKYRSIPGIGLVIMSAFELYDVELLDEEAQLPIASPTLEMVQKIIDDCLMLHDLVGSVKENKISERDAIQQLMLAKLSDSILNNGNEVHPLPLDFDPNKKDKIVEAALLITPTSDNCPIEAVISGDDTKLQEIKNSVQSVENSKADDIRELRDINEHATPQEDPYFRGMTNGLEVASAVLDDREGNFVESPNKKSKDYKKMKSKKGSPLKDFLENRKNKLKKHEYSISLSKAENVQCPDCGQHIFKNEVFSGCICYGDDADKKVYLAKSESGMKIRFGHGWDPENIEMLLDVLRRKRG